MARSRSFSVVVALVLLTQIDHAVGQAGSPTAPTERSAAAAIVGWNAIAQRTAITVAKQYQAQSLIYIALTHAAIYDAVVAIEGGYRPYGPRLPHKPTASIDAAVASSAHDVLVHYFPAQRDALDADYARALAAVVDGAAKSDGIAVGKAAAGQVIALRKGDGLEADVGFTMPPPAPGAWQLPAGVPPQTPWVARLRPFMLESPAQFRPGPPPDRGSEKFAIDFNEVRNLGGANSAARTPAQTETAIFWSTNAATQYNDAFAGVVNDRRLDAIRAARLFAMGNLVAADALIACFDAKYAFLFWRPQFAIPAGDSGANPALVGDPSWKPLLATPNHPEYPAAHGCLTAAAAEMFVVFLGTNRIDVRLTSSVPNSPPASRRYELDSDLLTEIANARVWGGLHYRDSVVKGAQVGREVARWTLQRFFVADN